MSVPNFQYKWFRGVPGDYREIVGATASSYTLGDDDVGLNIYAEVIFTDDSGETYLRSTDPVGPVENLEDRPAGLPLITGTVEEDSTLSVDVSAIQDDDGLTTPNFRYRWFRGTPGDYTRIDGESASTYTPTDQDVGLNVFVRVRFTDDSGETYARNSNLVGPIANIEDTPTGSPTLSGVAEENSTLEIDTASISDDDGLTTPNFQYRWFRGVPGDYREVAGETGRTYALGDDDVGLNVFAQVRFTDDTGVNYLRITGTLGPVINVEDAPIGAPVVTGVAQEDSTLTIDTSSIRDDDGLTTPDFRYRWFRGTPGAYSQIAGQTAQSFTLGNDDVGLSVYAEVTFTDDSGESYTRSTAVWGPVANVEDVPTGSPTVNGIAQEDSTLTIDTTSVNDDDGLSTPNFQYRWFRGTPGNYRLIAGATSSTYLLGDEDVGQSVYAEVTFTDDSGVTYVRPTSNVGPVANVEDLPTGLPSIIGLAQEDSTLSVDTGSINDDDGLTAPNFQYRWFRGNPGDYREVIGETTRTYKLGDADVGLNVYAEVGFTDDSGETYVRSTSTVGPVANVEDAPTGSPVINGTAREDSILSIDITSIGDDDGLTKPDFQYKWFRGTPGDYREIAGETADHYTLGDQDVGLRIRGVVTFTDDAGNRYVRSTNLVGPVANVNDSPVGRPVITGDFVEHKTLTVNLGGISDDDGTPSTAAVQWYRGTERIRGATAITYSLDDSDVGKRIRVVVTYVDLQGTTETVSSALTPVIAGVNDPPTLANRTRHVLAGEKLTVGAGLFRQASNDADGDLLEAILVAPPESGNLILRDDGAFVYTPEADFFGTVSFTWQASDGVAVSNVATVTIVIAPPINTPGPTTEPIDETSDSTGDQDSSDQTDPPDETETPATVGTPNEGVDDSGGTPLGDSPETIRNGVSIVEDEGKDGLRIGFREERGFGFNQTLTREGLQQRIHQFEFDWLDAQKQGMSRTLASIADSATNGIAMTDWTTFSMLASPGELWNQLDATQAELESLLSTEQLVVGSVGAATGGFTVAVLSWLRSGFLVLGLWQQRPIWSQMDPVVLMQGLRSKDSESLADIMATEKQKLEETDS